MEGSQPANQIPTAPALKRSKFIWRIVLIFNFGLGAYMFAGAGKKERGKEKTEAPAEVTPSPATPTVPTLEEPAFSPPIAEPVIVRQPIPEDRQRELFTWMLEEKRKVKPRNREEKHKIDEEKAILKEFIRSKRYSKLSEPSGTFLLFPMPGTIQVTVLEFKGASSSSEPSAKSLKVSMGKTQYQTWDKGDFSFPITKLREDLVVTLLDAGGNEIAHADIRTMQIIERGSWDEVFSINDGGHAHMKLQVILNEEERNRIRIVRESAMKKKLETNPNINLKPSETVSSEEKSTKNEHKVPDSYKGFVEIDVMSPKAEASQAGLPSNSATSSAVTPSTHQKKEESILESTIPVKELPVNTTDGSEGATPSSPQVHEQVDIRSNVEKGSSSKLSGLVISELKNDPIQKSQNQGPLEKTPSNVRKMISAFENNQLQEVKTLMKRSPSAPSNLNRFRKEPSEDREQKEEKNYGKFNHFAEAPKELDSRAKIVKEMENSPVDIMRQSTSETATSSGRMLDEQSPVGGAYKLSSKLISSSESPVAEGSGGGRGIGLKGLTVVDVQVVSNPKRKSLENYKEECYSTQSCGMWIFPDNTRRLCITTAGKQVMNIVGNQRKEAKACQAKKISSEAQVLEKNPMHGTKHKMEKNRNRVAKQPESAHGSSPDDSSRGVIGQVIKIAVILGFGALVLLTRQKEPRKKQKEQNDDLFPVPDYIDKRTMKPWPLQQ